jgi:biopolymer transport protein ExbD
MAPALNVLFLVFMLFAMSSRFVLQPGIAVTLPRSSFTLAPPSQEQIVSITAAPAPAIYFRGRKVSLDEFAAQIATKEVAQRSLIIKADRATPYELVTKIMNQALLRGYSVVLAATPEPQS